MEKYLNKNELVPGLLRAVITFLMIYLVFHEKLDLKIVSSGVDAIMIIMIVMMAYIVGTLFIPESSRWLVIAVHVLDCALLGGLILATGGARSYLIFALPILVPGAAWRAGTATAIATAATAALFTLFLSFTAFPHDIYRVLFWIFCFTAMYLLSISLFSNKQSRKFELLYQNLEKRNDELEKQVSDLEQKLSQFTIIDPVTGMKNFRYFRLRVEEELKRAERQHYPFCVCIMGLDGYEEFLKHYGESEGRKVLLRVSALLQKSVRDTDLIAKYTADQFLILLPQSTPPQSIIPVKRIRQLLGKAGFGPDNTFTLEYSFGVSGFPDDVQELGGLFSLASAALERSRQRGVGMVTLASSLWRTQR